MFAALNLAQHACIAETPQSRFIHLSHLVTPDPVQDLGVAQTSTY